MDKFAFLFDQGGLSLDRLRNFSLIAEAGGLSKAAGGDPGRMSLYSRQVKELETFFGVELTRRHGKGIIITAEGLRLGRLVREHLLALEDLRRTGQGKPAPVSLGAGNSLLEWVVLPHLGELHRLLPDLHLELASLRTKDVVERLCDLTLNFGLIREDAAQAAGKRLKTVRLFTLDYALFAPRNLVSVPQGKAPVDLPKLLDDLPLAAPTGGQFRAHLETSAARAACPLNIVLACSSFTQAARAVRSGCYGAILPSIAQVDFAGAEAVKIPVPFLHGYTRPICLAWNARLPDLRPGTPAVVNALQQAFNPDQATAPSTDRVANKRARSAKRS